MLGYPNVLLQLQLQRRPLCELILQNPPLARHASILQATSQHGESDKPRRQPKAARLRLHRKRRRPLLLLTSPPRKPSYRRRLATFPQLSVAKALLADALTVSHHPLPAMKAQAAKHQPNGVLVHDERIRAAMGRQQIGLRLASRNCVALRVETSHLQMP